MIEDILLKLDTMIADPKCELEYHQDYELLIATVLSAQTTDARVNSVTKELFNKYDIYSLANALKKDIEKIIRPCGTYTKKAGYIIDIAQHLVNDCDGHVINDRKYLESLPGVGRKTCNVVLSMLFNEPAIAVDTHVDRVSKRLGLVAQNADVLEVEKKLCDLIDKDKWSRCHLQLVLFGRYICKAKKPECSNCLLKDRCKYYNFKQ